MIDDLEPNADGVLPPSKTQRKKAMTALQELGEAIVNLTDRQLTTIPLDENIKDAILQARKITSREGKRRQLQYIGKLMRRIDTDAMASALQQLQDGRQDINREFHRLEILRDKLLAAPDDIEPALAAFPDLDRQHLRQLLRQAEKERVENKPPAAARKLFRYLRELAQL